MENDIPEELLIHGLIDHGIPAKNARVLCLFTPYAMQRRAKVELAKLRFVHYTAAETALKIANDKHIWLRNVRMMNDWSETFQGAGLARSFLTSGPGEALLGSLDSIYLGIASKIRRQFEDWSPNITDDTYIFCLSEHGALAHASHDLEDTCGRLSMWRAYGAPVGVAIVINPAPLLTFTDAIGAFSYPVDYRPIPVITKQLEAIAQRGVAEVEFLNTFTEEELVEWVINMLESLVICAKHPAFSEEREWRIVYRPKRRITSRLKKSVETIGGKPQILYKLELKNLPGGMDGPSIPQLLERIIVGPTDEPEQIGKAIIERLGQLHVPHPSEKVFISHIPLR